MEKLILQNKLAVGDCICLLTTIKNIHLNYPNRSQIGVLSYYPEVFKNSEFITDFSVHDIIGSIPVINVTYADYLDKIKKEKIHYVNGFIFDINNKLNLNIKLIDNKPEINLTEEEINKGKRILKENGINKPFWLLASGFKLDMPLKTYSPRKYQELINILNDKNICLVQTGDNKQINPKFKNVISLVGKTNDLRDYFSVCYLSDGMIGHTSLQLHVASAFNKKCIILCGGRELPEYSKYKDQIFLNSIGKLSCCKESGCWKKQIFECENYENGEPKCMNMISINNIVDCVLNYNKYI
jgi:ADP-heptose:LPS heptosyltransferase